MPEATALVIRAIAIGRELVRVCDAIGQPIAGNHITLGLELLSAHCELATGMMLGELAEIGCHDLDTAGGQTDDAAAGVRPVARPLDEAALGQGF